MKVGEIWEPIENQHDELIRIHGLTTYKNSDAVTYQWYNMELDNVGSDVYIAGREAFIKIFRRHYESR